MLSVKKRKSKKKRVDKRKIKIIMGGIKLEYECAYLRISFCIGGFHNMY